jgi:hypothetical protein
MEREKHLRISQRRGAGKAAMLLVIQMKLGTYGSQPVRFEKTLDPVAITLFQK